MTHERGWSCEPRCNGCDKKACDLVCVGKPKTFARALREIRTSFGWRDIGPISSPRELPSYVPTIHHASQRQLPLYTPWAAIPLRSILKRLITDPKPIATTPEELRDRFGIGRETNVLLLGVGEDKYIERYWRWRSTHALPEALACLGLSGGIAPNFSFFRDDPPPQKLHNRKRSLMCAEEWSNRGILSVPCLLGLTNSDYEYWRDFLQAHPETTVVCKEFQTGLGRREVGIDALNAIGKIQERLKRPLHLVAVGGAQYRSEISQRFNSWTLIDSVPFMKTVKRQVGVLGERRIHWRSMKDADLDQLLRENLDLYRDWLSTPYTAAERVTRQQAGSRDFLQGCLPLAWGHN